MYNTWNSQQTPQARQIIHEYQARAVRRRIWDSFLAAGHRHQPYPQELTPEPFAYDSAIPQPPRRHFQSQTSTLSSTSQHQWSVPPQPPQPPPQPSREPFPSAMPPVRSFQAPNTQAASQTNQHQPQNPFQHQLPHEPVFFNMSLPYPALNGRNASAPFDPASVLLPHQREQLKSGNANVALEERIKALEQQAEIDQRKINEQQLRMQQQAEQIQRNQVVLLEEVREMVALLLCKVEDIGGQGEGRNVNGGGEDAGNKVEQEEGATDMKDWWR
ncbi:MAG: hypothetical protein M1831_004401 [Alyxoria varia]|nr:MAG: hypothetical protein M1831_004401 [Alyxoria varia]